LSPKRGSASLLAPRRRPRGARGPSTSTRRWRHRPEAVRARCVLPPTAQVPHIHGRPHINPIRARRLRWCAAGILESDMLLRKNLHRFAERHDGLIAKLARCASAWCDDAGPMINPGVRAATCRPEAPAARRKKVAVDPLAGWRPRTAPYLGVLDACSKRTGRIDGISGNVGRLR